MRKVICKQSILAAAMAAVSLNASAVAPGFYMGLMMGPTANNGSQQTIQVMPLPTSTSPQANTGIANPKGSLFASRLYFGYKFNPYAGFEGGFTYISGINYTLKNASQTPAAGTTARVRGIDVVGKLDFTIKDTIGFFGKAGVAGLYTTTPGALNITNFNATTGRTSGANTYSSKLTPTFSVGASYDFDQNWQTDLTWMRLMPGGAIGNLDTYALGLSYHFVDKYCGQFLCN